MHPRLAHVQLRRRPLWPAVRSSSLDQPLGPGHCGVEGWPHDESLRHLETPAVADPRILGGDHVLRGRMKTKRGRRDPHSRTVVRLPERDLAESILDLAAPLLEPLGSAALPGEVRPALDVAVRLWNAHVTASLFWGNPRPKALTDRRREMCGEQAPHGVVESFEPLSARWRKRFDLDPRLVADGSFDAGDDGRYRLVCQMALPDGVEAHVDRPRDQIAAAAQYVRRTTKDIGLRPPPGLMMPVPPPRSCVPMKLPE